MKALKNPSDPFYLLGTIFFLAFPSVLPSWLWPLQSCTSGLLCSACFWDAEIREKLRSVMENCIKCTHDAFEKEKGQGTCQKDNGQAKRCSLPEGFGIGARH